MTPRDFPYLTVEEAAALLEVIPRQVTRLIEEDRMPRSFKFGMVWAVHKQDVAEHLKRRAERIEKALAKLK